MTDANESASPSSETPQVVEEKKTSETPEQAPARRERRQVAIARLERVLVVMVLALSFMLGSFVARNSDVWMHLAAGRFHWSGLMEGKFPSGKDPFSYTTESTYWTNHSWLYDILFYGLSMVTGGLDGTGGVVAVLLKALLVTLLAGVMLATRRPGQTRWAPVVCVLLAVLAMSPRLLLQPFSVSLLFLGVTLYFLTRESKRPAIPEAKGLRSLFITSPSRLYVLPVLFVLWVNLDHWFILGPATVGLYLLGEWLQQTFAPLRTGPDAPDPGELGALARCFGLGLVACLVSPHHFHVFWPLPPELYSYGAVGALKSDPLFQPMFISPLLDYWTFLTNTGLGLNVAGLGWLFLLVLGVVSFFLVGASWRDWRLVVWSAFGVLSLSNYRLIPFFAVVAAPITALNLQDAVAAEAGKTGPAPDEQQGQVGLVGRWLTLLLGIILLLAAWPGFLGPAPYITHRVGWGVETETSLVQALARLREWRREGLISPQDQGFNVSPEFANYAAWFCPEEKGFFDTRYALLGDQSPVFTQIRLAISLPSQPTGGTLSPDAERQRLLQADGVRLKTFRERGIHHVILTGSTSERTFPMLFNLLRDARQWKLLYMDGRTTILGWNDPEQHSDRFARLTFDPSPLAFGPQATQAPPTGLERPPHPPGWAERYLSTSPARPIDGDEAAMEIFYFDVMGKRMMQAHSVEWDRGFRVGLAGLAAPGGNPLAVTAAFATRVQLYSWMGNAFLASQDQGPPAPLLLAVRAARRAVLANPDDPVGYHMVAGTIEQLRRLQEDHWARFSEQRAPTPTQLRQFMEKQRSPPPAYLVPWLLRSVSLRGQVRQVQRLTALHHALVLQPDSPQIHRNLADVYWQMCYYDLSLEHLRQELKYFKTGAAQAFGSLKDQETNLKSRVQALQTREKEVQDLQRDYELAAANQPPLVQAQRAFHAFGLPQQALAILGKEQQENPRSFSEQDVALLLYLRLTTGQASELREEQRQDSGGRLPVELEKVLGFQYDWSNALLAAALGNYKAAVQDLEQAEQKLAPMMKSPLGNLLQGMTFGQLDPSVGRLTLMPLVQSQQVQALNNLVYLLDLEGQLIVLRGLLALEAGDIDAARRAFRQALHPVSPAIYFESKPIAERYLELIEGKKK